MMYLSLGAGMLSLIIKLSVLDPVKVVAKSPMVVWATRRKLGQAEAGTTPLADLILNAAAVVDGSANETSRLMRSIKQVVATNRAIEELQCKAVRQALQQAKAQVAADAESKLAAAIQAALSGVTGSTEHVATLQQALRFKNA